eukprot:2143154-Rhodomonas_salina.3
MAATAQSNHEQGESERRRRGRIECRPARQSEKNREMKNTGRCICLGRRVCATSKGSHEHEGGLCVSCLLYTSDAADDM